MNRFVRLSVAALIAAAFAIGVSAQGAQAQPATSTATGSPGAPPILGPAGVAMAEPTAYPPGKTSRALVQSPSPAGKINATYTHTPPGNSSNNLSAGIGPVMTSTVIYYDFWLPSTPTQLHFETNTAGDSNYESLLIQFAKDIGSTQYHNIITQYGGTNGTTGNSVTYGGSWTDSAAYPHPGTTASPLTDADIQAEVHNAASTNGWTQDVNHIIAVFTATGIHECMAAGSPCTFSSSNGFCAYHDHFSDGGKDTTYAYMAFDNFTHATGKTCVAGQTGTDTDPNRFNYPNGDVSADAEINTFSHELIEAETDPHPNATWTGALGEIGDACNFTFAPRNDKGADVFLNGHGYIVQEEYSNLVQTCAIDLPTSGFCSGSVGNVCSPVTTYTKAVDNPTPSLQSTINYTINLNDTSDTGAETNLAVTDNVPTGYTVTGVSAPSSTTSSSTATSVSVAYDTLPVHQTRSITVTVTVPSGAGAMATNCGGLSGQDLLGTTLPSQTTVPCAQTTISKGSSTTALISSVNPSVFAQAVMFTATVAPVAPATTTPGGNVEFFDGTTSLGTKPLVGGTAGLSTSTLSVGSHSITATYGGSADFNGSTSSMLKQVVNKQPTTTTLTCAPPSAAVNQLVSCTATVSMTISNPTPLSGTVSFYVDGSVSPAATLPVGTGSAVWNTTFGGGSHNVVAIYSGDANYKTSSSSPALVTVNCDQTITGTHSGLTVTSGTTCLLNATITGGISVGRGAVLDVENSTVYGSISASYPATFRMCASHTGSVTVGHAAGFVVIGDPTNNCAANTVNGSILAAYNTGGLVIVANTVSGSVTAVGNSGAGPLPGESTPIVSGNHH
ncbi:MAG: Ig-like domain repeat protein [Actinomycetota bacterium]|nr:Ig-like domain repeat protein [Actinomycetota bacterium]